MLTRQDSGCSLEKCNLR